ncbi:hypothetical protein ACWEQ4_01405 [Rhodococcus sp. NPDC003994]
MSLRTEDVTAGITALADAADLSALMEVQAHLTIALDRVAPLRVIDYVREKYPTAVTLELAFEESYWSDSLIDTDGNRIRNADGDLYLDDEDLDDLLRTLRPGSIPYRYTDPIRPLNGAGGWFIDIPPTP